MMIGFGGNSIVKRVIFKNPDGTVAGSMSYTKAKSKTKNNYKKKFNPLEYNFKQVSARILSAKTSANAAQVVLFARSKVVTLRRKTKTGEYGEHELDAAIIHAERMLRIAKKKKRNLQEEERAEKAGKTEGKEQLELEDLQKQEEDSGEVMVDGKELSKEELQRMIQEMQRLMEETMKSLEDDGMLDELSDELLVNPDDLAPEDLEMRKKKHRSDEMREIAEADMKYLRALFNRLEKEKSSAASSSFGEGFSDSSGGVSLELGGVETAIASTEVSVPAAAEGANMDVTV